MPIGINLQLFDGNTPRVNLTGIQALWWDVTEPKNASRPIGKSSLVTTDASGFISLDLSNVTGLSLGQSGFLMLYKLDAGNHQDSLVFSGKVATSNVASGVDMYYYDSGWTRPVGWLPLPAVADTEQKVVGLYQVLPGSSFIAVTCTGAYTVDWGDGTVENFATGVQAQRLYDYTNAAFNGTEITVDSLTYKQAVVTITPQAGQGLTSVGLNARHTSSATIYRAGWLDVLFSLPASTAPGFNYGAEVVSLGSIERMRLISMGACTDLSYFFSGLLSLQSVSLPDTSAVTNFEGIFENCASLRKAPLLNTSSNLIFDYMFYGCRSLQSVPMMDTSAGTSFIRGFEGCRALLTVPLLDFSSMLDLQYLFRNCISLESVPELYTPLVDNFSYMFENCTRLTKVSLPNTSAGTYLYSMFSGCSNLVSVSLPDTSIAYDFGNMFNLCYSLRDVVMPHTESASSYYGTFGGCTSLVAIPVLNTSSALDLGNMFIGCTRLKSVQLMSTSTVTSFSNMFSSCSSLEAVPAFNTSGATSISSIFSNCPSLSRVAITGTKVSVSYLNCKLSAAALNEIYTNLATVTAKTITVTGNWGTAADNPAIATAKGWTVTG